MELLQAFVYPSPDHDFLSDELCAQFLFSHLPRPIELHHSRLLVDFLCLDVLFRTNYASSLLFCCSNNNDLPLGHYDQHVRRQAISYVQAAGAATLVGVGCQRAGSASRVLFRD